MKQKEIASCIRCKAILYRKKSVGLKDRVVIPKLEKRNTDGDISVDPPMIHVLDYHGGSYDFDLQYGLNIIGREDDDNLDNRIAIPTKDRKIDTKHLGIKVYNQSIGDRNVLAITCLDLMSSDGTYLNGFSKHALSKDDVIYIEHLDVLKCGGARITILSPLGKKLLIAKKEFKGEENKKTQYGVSPKTEIIV